MLFGCRPSFGVGAETVMFEEIAEALLTNFDPRSLVCLFPQALSDLIGTDSNFELSAPPSIKNLRLLYYFNIVAEIRAVIFCNSEIQGRPGAPAMEYREAKAKCEKVGSMFKNTLKVQAENVEECHDFNKGQIIAKMSDLKERAQSFQSKNNEVFLVCIAFIGFSLDPVYA